MKSLHLPYIQPMAARQYSYYIIPKMLISDPAFAGLHCMAKLIYSLMLNRLSLSAENAEQYTDEQGRLFIVYTVEQIMEDVQCAKATAVKMVQQLADIGLIEKKRRGQGKPTLIYVKDFTAVPQSAPAKTESVPASPVSDEGHAEQEPAVGGEPHKNAGDPRSIKIELQEVHTDEKSTVQTSRSSKFELQEVQDLKSNYLDLRKNYKSNSFLPSVVSPPEDGGTEGAAAHDEDIEHLLETVWEQIDGDALVCDYGDEIQGVVRMIADVLCRSGPATYGKHTYPEAAVKSRFRSLEAEHVRHALDKLHRAEGIKNIHAYLETLLFNSPTYLESEVAQQCGS